ncbi:MAG: hypothetical protein Q7J61_00920 [Deltaproteobacteria bacterium]|nr:hypothetical protein [Deltaproteobacteria bacterium]
METDKDKIRAIYAEIQGYLSQTPKPNSPADIFATNSSWERYNKAVQDLSKITGEDYGRFQIKPKRQDGYEIVHIEDYRQALNGFINSLHAVYFADEPQPFGGFPTTVISQNQYQVQSVQMLLDIQSKIDIKLQKLQEDTPKKRFLEKLKGSLSSVKNVTDLLALVLKLAKDFNLNIGDLASIFM